MVWLDPLQEPPPYSDADVGVCHMPAYLDDPQNVEINWRVECQFM